LRLHQVQHRQQGRARLGVPGDDLLRVGRQPGARLLVVPDGVPLARDPAGLVGRCCARVLDGHQRSTPPSTGSIDATATTTSATCPPSHIMETACRLLNDGSRKCARYGLVPPSETRCTPSSPRGCSTVWNVWPAGTRNPSVT